jgi:hypothetical protein
MDGLRVREKEWWEKTTCRLAAWLPSLAKPAKHADWANQANQTAWLGWLGPLGKPSKLGGLAKLARPARPAGLVWLAWANQENSNSMFKYFRSANFSNFIALYEGVGRHHFVCLHMRNHPTLDHSSLSQPMKNQQQQLEQQEGKTCTATGPSSAAARSRLLTAAPSV